MQNMTADRFNELYPVGQAVNYYRLKPSPTDLPGTNDAIPTHTRSEAWTIGGEKHPCHIVKVEGTAGGVDIAHLEIVVAEKNLTA